MGRAILCVGTALRQKGRALTPLAPRFSRLPGFLALARTCRTRCRRDARRAAAGAVALLDVLAKRTITERCAMVVMLKMVMSF